MSLVKAAAFKREIVDLLESELRARRFVKKARLRFAWDLGVPDVEGWAGFQQSLLDPDGAFELYPDVGIRHFGIEALLDELLPEPRPSLAPTAGTNIGYARGDNIDKGWYFSPRHNNRATAADLAATLQIDGVPYMRSLTDIANLIDEIAKDVGFEYTLPVALLYAGRTEDAERIVRQTSKELEDAPPTDWKAFYDQFAARFLAAANERRRRTSPDEHD